MSRYRLTPIAARDLEQACAFIARDRPSAARRFAHDVDEQCRRLAEFTEMGAACAELAPRLRHFPVGSYVIFYRPARDGIEVIRILHGARDIGALFRP